MTPDFVSGRSHVWSARGRLQRVALRGDIAPRAMPPSARWLLLFLLLGGCSGHELSHTISDSRLKEMSREGQLWIYDAENEIVVALDQLDEARDEVADIRHRIRKARDSVKRAKARNSALGVDVAQAWLGHLEELQVWAEAQVAWRQLGVVVARATVELAKAQVIQREDLLGGKDFDLANYRRQHDDLERALQAKSGELVRLRKAARQKELQWWRLRHRFVAQTGDHNSGLWID